MKKFEFRLQRLLDIRAAREDEIKNELASLVSVQNRERAMQEDLLEKMRASGLILGEQWRKGQFSARNAMMYGRFVDSASRAIESAEHRILDMEPAINEVRGRLIEASKEKKIVEKLKERKLEEYSYDLNREIARENDDMNQKIYMRNLRDAANEGARP
jgi:flagellar FliJ protein